MVASLTFLTPLAALVALAAFAPLLAFALGARRVARVRRVLALAPPPRAVDTQVLAAFVCVVLVLALGAAQPALSRTSTQRVRTDAAALFVIDTSQSMSAAPGPRQSTRLDRATILAERMRAAIPAVPAGVATLTDRVLPDLLPVSDAAAFDATLERAVGIEQPPPRAVAVRATSFAALAAVPQAGYFDPSAHRRVVVLLTDGETSIFDPAPVARAFTKSGTSFVGVRVWGANEAIYNAAGRRDPNYRPDPSGRAQLALLASAAGGRAFEERDAAAAVSEVKAALGRGPTKAVGHTRSTRPLAPLVALAALVPLAFVYRRRLRLAR
jgi:hypothetical protein